MSRTSIHQRNSKGCNPDRHYPLVRTLQVVHVRFEGSGILAQYCLTQYLTSSISQHERRHAQQKAGRVLTACKSEIVSYRYIASSIQLCSIAFLQFCLSSHLLRAVGLWLRSRLSALNFLHSHVTPDEELIAPPVDRSSQQYSRSPDWHGEHFATNPSQ